METLKEIRRQKGLSQKDLADASGVGQDTISGIESGRHEPRPSTLRKLAEALDVQVADFFREPVLPKAEAPRGARRTLADFLNERCGHAHLALSKEDIQARFDELEGVEDEEHKRRVLGLAINDEYNAFCKFPSNVTRQERFTMRGMIRDAITDVAVKHQLALWESGLWPEYQDEIKRIFDVERVVLSDEDIA